MKLRPYVLCTISLLIIAFLTACTQAETIEKATLTETPQLNIPTQESETKTPVFSGTTTPNSTTLLPEATPTSIPTSTATSTFIIDNTVILYATIQQVKLDSTPTPVALNTQGAFEVTSTVVTPSSSFVDYWALQAWPESLLLEQPVFDVFYGEAEKDDDIELYFLNFRPQASPNGRFILLPGIGGFTNPNGDLGTGLWLADLQENSVRQLLPQAKIATWSPQSDRITYVEGDTVYTLSIDEGAMPLPLFTHPNLNGLYARWSPDGQWIAIVTTMVDGSQSSNNPVETIWLVSPEGDENKQLTTTKEAGARGRVAGEITWSGDGQYLLVTGTVYNVADAQISPIYLGATAWVPGQNTLLVNSQDRLRLTTVEGVEIAMMGNSFSPAWNFSRNGQKLAYSQSTNDAQVNIFIFDLNTQEDQFIGAVPAAYLSILRWSGDGTYLIMDDGQDITPIWAMSAQPNSVAETIFDKGVLIEVAVLPDN